MLEDTNKTERKKIDGCSVKKNTTKNKNDGKKPEGNQEKLFSSFAPLLSFQLPENNGLGALLGA